MGRQTAARRHGDLDIAQRADLYHRSRQRAAVFYPVQPHRRTAGADAAAALYDGGERNAMMPTRKKTRSQHRSERIAAERRHNHQIGEARRKANDAYYDDYFGGRAPDDHGEPPPF